jgi:hypothetical protein
LSEPSFYAWRAELARRDGRGAKPRRDAERSTRPSFLPVTVGMSVSPAIEFQFPSGLAIHVPAHDREALRAVWELVEVRACSV